MSFLSVFDLRPGASSVLVSMPHVGTLIPEDLRDGYVPRALQLEDTDWHLDQLYRFAGTLGASVLRPHLSRYVIDLNRPPDDAPMYPGAANTELCPTRFFSGDALYREGHAPDAAERQRRRSLYWQPYHDALAAELARIKARHGYALLWDAHSIRSEIPWLFPGRLPDLNIGTAGGASAHRSVEQAVAAAAARHAPLTSVVNGRFKGGYITRHYGVPADHVHAVQLEMCQSLYMREAPPFDVLPDAARRIQPVLNEMVAAAARACEALHGRH